MVNKKISAKNIYAESVKYIKESSRYILTIVIIFLFFSIVSFFITFPEAFEIALAKKLKEIVIMFEGAGLLKTIWLIFSNNLYVAFLSIILGLFLGIFPIMASISNGIMVGFVAQKATQVDSIFILWKLLPHGIFEIPAIMISMGIGLRLGINIFKKKYNLKENSMKSLLVFLLIIEPLLIIAAIIEGVLIFVIK